MAGEVAEGPKICSICGAAVEPGATFCSFCDTSLQVAGVAEAAQQEPTQELVQEVQEKPTPVREEPGSTPQQPAPIEALPQGKEARKQPLGNASCVLGILALIPLVACWFLTSMIEMPVSLIAVAVIGLAVIPAAASLALGVAAAVAGILAVIRRQRRGWGGILLGGLVVAGSSCLISPYLGLIPLVLG